MADLNVKLSVEDYSGLMIATYVANFGPSGGSVMVAATQADLVLAHGFSYEEWTRIVPGWSPGVKFRAEIHAS